MAAFTYRSARSPGVIVGISIVLIVETFAFHMLLMTKHPLGAWAMTLSSLSALLWLMSDYRAMGTGTVNVSATDIDIRIGRRASVVIPRAKVESAIRPTFREVPQVVSGTGGYLNLMKQVSPNVLLTLHEPVVVSMAGIIRQPARQIALHLDDPPAFLAAISAWASRPPGSASAD